MDKNDTGNEVQGLLTKLRSAAEVIKNQFQWPENSMPPDDRRKRIAEIDLELQKLNEERDSLASDLMSTGMTQ